DLSKNDSIVPDDPAIAARPGIVGRRDPANRVRRSLQLFRRIAGERRMILQLLEREIVEVDALARHADLDANLRVRIRRRDGIGRATLQDSENQQYAPHFPSTQPMESTYRLPPTTRETLCADRSGRKSLMRFVS